MKKLTALLLALVMVLALAACGAQAPAETEAPAAAPEAPVEEAPAAKTAADLKGKLGAAETGSAGETYGKETFKDAVIKGFDVQTKCLLEVKSGTANFAILDAQLAKSYCGKGDYADLEIVEGLDSEVEYYAIGFKKGSELTAKVNEQLDALAKDGTISALADKYKVANTAIKDFADQKK